jgi:uncharacterized protein
MTARPRVSLRVLSGAYAVCRLPPDRELTVPVGAGELYAVTRTTDELSVVCEQTAAPADATVEPGWKAMVVAGPLDFSLVGILAAIADPLAAAGISIFAVSTYDTDYVLVKADQLDQAVAALRSAGHTLTP